MSEGSAPEATRLGRPLIDSALLAAALTAASYLVARGFQTGAAIAYGIPRTFVRLQIEYVVGAAAMMVSFMLVLGGGVALGLFAALRAKSLRIALLLHGVAVGAAGILLGLHYPPFFAIAVGAVVFTLAFMIWPSRMGRMLGVMSGSDAKSQPASLRRGFLILGFVLFVVFYVCAGNYGAWLATRRVDYPILATEPESVVLLQYDDILICAPLVRSEGGFLSVFTVYSLQRDGPFTLQYEMIGPLIGLEFPEDESAKPGEAP